MLPNWKTSGFLMRLVMQERCVCPLRLFQLRAPNQILPAHILHLGRQRGRLVQRRHIGSSADAVRSAYAATDNEGLYLTI